MTAKELRDFAYRIARALPMADGPVVEQFTSEHRREFLEICRDIYGAANAMDRQEAERRANPLIAEVERSAYEAIGVNVEPAADAAEREYDAAIFRTMADAIGAHADLWTASMIETCGEFTRTYRIERSPR